MASEVSGFAGSVRIAQLKTRNDLRSAERHGKRLDKAGRERSIRDAKPLTRSGLDVVDLYDRHSEGMFIQKNSTLAMHILIQFPKSLVDENEPGWMLDHAISFCRHAFGQASVFADRIDLDEKNRHVVDVFVAPTYLKVTKHTSKMAISSTKHLKEIARKHGEPPVPHGFGRALQTEFYDYLRQNMELMGVKRGQKKVRPGSDWKSAEELRLQELKDLRRDLNQAIGFAHDERSENIDYRIELDDQAMEMRRREEQLDEQARLQRQKGFELADEKQTLNDSWSALAKERAALKRILIQSKQRFAQIAEREADLSVREAANTVHENDLKEQQKGLDQRAGDLAVREQYLSAFEVGIMSLARGEIYSQRHSDGDYRLYCRAKVHRKEELDTQIRPAIERVRDLAQLNAEAVSKEVDKAVADERDMISSIQLAYLAAIEATRAQAESFRRLISRLGKEARKRLVADKELREAEAKANELAKPDTPEIPDELSVEQLAYLARIRGGSGIG